MGDAIWASSTVTWADPVTTWADTWTDPEYPTVIVEVAFDTHPLATTPTWTDVTAYVKSVQTSMGRQFELDAFQPGVARITLDNSDRRFDPLHTTGPYYGKLVPRKRIRVRAVVNGVSIPLWSGFVDTWPQESRAWAGEVALTATDGFGLLAAAPIAAAWEEEVRADTPVGWWRLGDDTPTHDVCADSSGNDRHGQYKGLPAAADGGLLAGADNGAVDFDGANDRVILDPAIIPTAGPLSIEAWIQTSTVAAGDQPIAGIFDIAGNSIMNLVVASTAGATDGFPRFNVYETSGSVTAEGVTSIADGHVHHLVGTWDSSDRKARLYIDGALVATTSATATLNLYQAGAPLAARIARWGGDRTTWTYFDGIIDEVAIYTTALSAARVLAHYEAGATPWFGDTTGERIGRVLDLAGWPTADRDLDTGISTLGAYELEETSALAAAQLAEASEGGAFWQAPDGNMTFRDRYAPVQDAAAISSHAEFSDAQETDAWLLPGARLADGIFDNRETAQAVVLCVGDSITEGYSAGTFAQRWMTLLQDALRERFPTSGIGVGGGVGYIPAWRPYPSALLFPQPASVTGTVSSSSNVGIGHRALTIGTGGSVSFTVTGDLIEVWTSTATGGIDPIEVAVDGGTAKLIPCDSGVGSFQDEYALIDLGTSGAHTVVVTRHAGGALYAPTLGGIRVFDGDGPTSRYMSLPGVSGYASTADTAALSITGDLDLRAKARLTDWTPATETNLVGKWNSFGGATQRSYRLAVDTTGHLLLSWSTDGTATVTATSTVAPFTDGLDYWVRATLDVDLAGQWQVKFYQSSDTTNDHALVSWTLIDTVDGATGPTSIYDSTSRAIVGAVYSATPGYALGRVYAAAILSGIAGTVVAAPTFTNGTRVVETASGNTWSLSGDATLVATGSKGIQLVDAARAGSTLQTFADGVTGGSALISDIAPWSEQLDPALIIIAPFVNEWQTSVAVATAKANLQTVISELRLADATTPVLLVAWPEPSAGWAGTVPWADYMTALEEVAAADSITAFVNFNDADAPDVALDTGLHPTAAGHATIATMLTRALSPLAINPLHYTALTLDYDDGLIANTVTVDWTGGTETVSDTASITAYGRSENSASTALTTAAEAQARAQWTLARFAEPQVRPTAATFRPAADHRLWRACLTLGVGDRVTVTRTPANTGAPIEFDCLVEGVTHRVDDGINTWETVFNLSPTDVGLGWLILDDTVEGLLDTGRLAY